MLVADFARVFRKPPEFFRLVPARLGGPSKRLGRVGSARMLLGHQDSTMP